MIEQENPKKEEVSEDFLKKFKETTDEFLRLAEKGASLITVEHVLSTD